MITDYIDPMDRGLHYGDGLFETMRVCNGRIALWPFHCERLSNSCQRLNLPIDISTIELQAYQQATELSDGIIKLIITRGVGQRGYRVPEGIKPTVLWYQYELPHFPAEYARTGIKACICRTRLGANPALAGIKHLNRLEQVLARMEWQDEYQEGLMCNEQGYVIEGVMSNLFIISDGDILTPELHHQGVAGVMRAYLLDKLAQEGIHVDVRNIMLEELLTADDAILTNSLVGGWPIRTIADKTYAMGKHCQQLIHWLQQVWY